MSSRGAHKAVNRRLALSETSTDKAELLDVLRNERGFTDFDSPALTKVNDFFVQTGLRVSRTALALSTLIAAAVIGFVLWELSLRPWMAAAGGLILAPCVVGMYLAVARRKRISRFAEQFPDALDIIVRGLRVGHPFSSAIQLVAREMRDPIGTELGITADEMTFGQDIITAVTNLHRRVGQDDLLFLAIAVSVQTQTGGESGRRAGPSRLADARAHHDGAENKGAERGRAAVRMVSVRHAVRSFWRHPTASQRLLHHFVGKSGARSSNVLWICLLDPIQYSNLSHG